MKNKNTLVIAAFLTVFLITIGIGVVTNVSAKNKQIVTAPTADITAFLEREAAYQQKINEANQQIAIANEQITTLLNAATQTPVATTASPYLFSAEQASALAKLVAGVLPQTAPELVNYNDNPTYEVVYSNGKVYIDANTGRIVFNGLQKQAAYITSDQALKIAKTYLGSDQVTKIDFGVFNGLKVYVVSFANGQSVYINLFGKIVAVQMPQVNPTPGPTTPPQEDDD
jgi:uncharacterized membrane protein YkoI